MEQWLNKLWHRFRRTKFGVAILFLVVLFALLTVVALTSEIGFGEEVRRHRVAILEIALAATLLFIFCSAYIRTARERNSFKKDVTDLKETVSDLEQQKESAFRLMERYKEETQENVVSRLIQLAIFSLKLSDWQAKGAKIERFRIEESSINTELDLEMSIAEHVTVLINIGANDRVLKGMRFSVHDPTDSEKYGVIVVKDTSSTGSACAIVEMNHQAFWYDVVQAIEAGDGKPRILNASANVIVPSSALKGMNRESAKQLLEWLQTMERAEL